MAMIARSASGLRHLRFAREVEGSLEALAASGVLTEPDRAAVEQEIDLLAGRVRELSAAVKPYRDWLERERTKLRGKKRVSLALATRALEEAGVARDGDARRWSDESAERVRAELEARASQGARGTDAAALALRALDAAIDEAKTVEAPRRHALGSALASAIEALRETMLHIEERLRARLDASLVDALYPELARDDAYVVDVDDPNDDATASV